MQPLHSVSSTIHFRPRPGGLNGADKPEEERYSAVTALHLFSLRYQISTHPDTDPEPIYHIGGPRVR